MKSLLKRGFQPNLKQLLSLLTILLAVCANVVSAQTADGDEPAPVMISDANSTRALTAIFKTGRGFNLPRGNNQVFLPGENSRVTLYVGNLNLLPDEGANAVRLYAEDANGKIYRLTVESLKPQKGQPGVYALAARLYDENGYNGQPAANGDVLLRLTWHGLTSNRVRLGLGSIGGAIKDDDDAIPTPLASVAANKNSKPISLNREYNSGGDRARFIEQASFGANAAVNFRIKQIGVRRWLEEQFEKPYPSIPYPNLDQKVTDASIGCPGDNTTAPVQKCIRDIYTQIQNQQWQFKEAMYGDDQLRRRVSWALSQIWVVSGNDTQEQRWMQEYIKILDKNAFGNYRNLMGEMTLNPAMGNYLDMVRSNRFNPNENYPREIMQLFSVGLIMLNQDGTPMLDQNGNQIPTYDQDKVTNFTRVYTGWTLCQSAPSICPNNAGGGVPNYIDPMLLTPGNHDLTQKTLFNYPGAPNPVITACTNCTTDAAKKAYAETSLAQTLDNIFYHPNVGPFVSRLLIQHLVTGAPSPAYVGRVAAVFNNNGAGVRGDMRSVVRAILLDPEARGSIKTAPDYGKLREPFELATNLFSQFDAKSADRSQLSDGYIPQMSGMGQNVWYSPTVFNYFSPDYVVPGTDLNGPEFGIYTSSTAFARINFINTMVYGKIAASADTVNGVAPAGTALSFAQPQSWASSDATGNTLIEGLNQKMLRGAMSQAMKDRLRTAVTAIPITTTNYALLRAQQAVYLVASSSQYQVQK